MKSKMIINRRGTEGVRGARCFDLSMIEMNLIRCIGSFMLCVLLGVSSASAQSFGMKSFHWIYGGVYDSFTRESLKGARVYLMKADSTVVDSVLVQEGMSINYHTNPWFFSVSKKTEPYIAYFVKEGYTEFYFDIKPISFGRNPAHFIKDVYLKKKPKNRALGEAVVKATRVKIYTKGDTVVYNADAFQLAEGSMLDALIRQLPGVELKDDGRILVNGKYVDNLLLNGEDFFKKDRSVMLDNLPSYMVNNVKIYEKQGRLGQMMGRKMGDEEYVMDVNLKKQYSIGWIANAEAALGSEDRHLARLFALRFTPQSRLSFFGNVNNLNETRKPGQDGEWSPERLSGGLVSTKTFGTDYSVKDRKKTFDFSGSAKFEYSDIDNQTSTSSEKFMPQGNVWTRNDHLQRSKNIKVETNHELFFQSTDKYKFTFSPYLSYTKWNNRGNSASATFLENPSLYVSEGLLDSIRSPHSGALLRRLAVNRTLSDSKIDGNSLNGGLSGQAYIRSVGSDILLLSASVNYKESKEDRFSHFLLDYPSNSEAQSDYRNRWSKDSPNRNLNYNASAQYYYVLPINLIFAPKYEFGRNTSKHNNALFRLDQLAGWGEGNDHTLGQLPSETDFMINTIDNWNSYRMRTTDMWHKAELYTKWEVYDGKDELWGVHATVRLEFMNNRLDYKRATVDSVFRRNTVFLIPEIKLKRSWHKWHRDIELKYSASSSAPGMTTLIDLEENSDPLAVYRGNPNLRNSHTHNVSLNYQNHSSRKQRFFTANVNYSVTKDAFAWGYVYDRSTGVYSYTSDNVNGNYTIHSGINYSMPLDKQKRLTLTSRTFAQLYHNVDLISVHDIATRSAVNTVWMTESVKLDYRINKTKVGVKIDGSWNNATSRREGFETVNVGDFNYGITGQLSLPWDLQLNTDLTMFSRRGYSDRGANSDDLVWNASLSKRVMKGNLTFKLDGFDLLGQLSNVTQSVNSQGRFETYRNVIPQYVMLHCVYRLNIKPKKRPGE